MGETLKALESASRRELQALAKELQLCRGNAKSEVIVKCAMQFLNDHPEDGEQQVLSVLGFCEGSSPMTPPKPAERILKKEIRNDNQPEHEPPVEIKNRNADMKQESHMPQKDEMNRCKMNSPRAGNVKSPGTDASPAQSPKSGARSPILTSKSPMTVFTSSTCKTLQNDKKNHSNQASSSAGTAKSSPSGASCVKNLKSGTIAPKSTCKSQTTTTTSMNSCEQVSLPPGTVKSPPTVASPAKSCTESPISNSFTATTSKPPPSYQGKDSTTSKAIPVGKNVDSKARKAVEALVTSVPDLMFVGESRVRCSTTGHEMVADASVIQMHIQGKRYKKARNLKRSFANYAPMFVDHPDKSKPDMLWCNVTESSIARDEERVKDHIAACKYQKQLPIWKEQEAAKKKAEEEEARRRAARIEAAKKRRLEVTKGNSDDAKTTSKRKRTAGTVAWSNK